MWFTLLAEILEFRRLPELTLLEGLRGKLTLSARYELFSPSPSSDMPTLTMAAYIAMASNGKLSPPTVAGKAADATGY
jgi:hypothetical protein